MARKQWITETTPVSGDSELDDLYIYARTSDGSARFLPVAPIISRAVTQAVHDAVQQSVAAIPVVDWSPVIDAEIAAAIAALGVPKADGLAAGRYELEITASGEQWVPAAPAAGTPPAAPTIDAVETNDVVSAAEAADGVTITGTAEVASTVSVSWGSVNKSDTADGSGIWSVSYAAGEVPAAGSTTVSASATNSDGTGPVATRAVTVETAAPVYSAAPVISGSGSIGSTLTRIRGTASGSPTYTGQWMRHGVEAISGETASTYVVAAADVGPTRLSFLSYDLYDGGLCPTPAVAQTNNYYVDPTNGSDSNNGTSDSTPWKTVNGRTLSNAVVWVLQPGSGDTHDMTGTVATDSSWWANNTANNVTVRPVGEDAIWIANNVSTDGNQSGAGVYMSTGCTDVTFYKLGFDGFGQGFYLEYGVTRPRILRCMAKNPFLESDPSATTAHHVYMGYNSGSNRITEAEIAYCTFENERTGRMGGVLQNFGGNSGVREFAMHHNIVLGGNYTYFILQAEYATQAAAVFANTVMGSFSQLLDFSPLGNGAAVNSNYKVHSNIFSNSHASPLMVWQHGAHTPDLGANNTCYASAAACQFIGTTLAAVGQERNPSLDADGVASNVLEQGTGALLSAAAGWLGFDGELPSSTTNIDRGAHQYGTASGRPGRIVYKETATNSAGSVTSDSNAIAVTV